MESTKQKNKNQKASSKNTENELFQKIISHCKEYGFVFQSSEIYDGLQAVYDYGQNGAALRNNLQQAWWLAMMRLHDNIVGIDSAIFMHPTTWQASGHVEGFNDPMIDNKDSQKRYRADQIIENKAEQYRKEGNEQRANELVDKMNDRLKKEDLEGVRDLIIKENIVCEISKTANWTEVRQFNLMFSTQIGSVDNESSEIYLRPETAQGIFVNYLNVQKTSRLQPPFGIAQVGKAFRNEIVARQFIMRMREFTQMEMQFFIKPGTQQEWFEKWKENRYKWHLAIGTPTEKLRFHVHDKLAHYADAAEDIEFNYPIGWKEMEGIHSRTDFDLKQHEEHSRKKLRFHDPQAKENYVPYVIETSIGLDRLFLSVISNAYQEIESTNENAKTETRIVLSFPAALAPVKVAIFPLTKKDGLPEKAMEIVNDLKLDLETFYEESAAIGKRYARQDVIGTPFCVTIDHDTLEDNTVTLRYRDTTEQIRIPISELKEKLVYECSMSRILEKLI